MPAKKILFVFDINKEVDIFVLILNLTSINIVTKT